MTPLRQRMVEDMKIRHFSPDTRYRYILSVEKFAQHFGRSPERGQMEIEWRLGGFGQLVEEIGS